MTDISPAGSSDESRNSTPPPVATLGAVLSDAQIARLRRIVIVMTTVLVAGIALLIGRVIYLASNRGEAAVALTAMPTLAPDAVLFVPAGASLKSTTISGNRLTAHYSSPTGEGLVILDLGSGRQLSHIRVSPRP